MSNILQAFMILFETDAKAAQREVEAAGAAGEKTAAQLDKAGDALKGALAEAGAAARAISDALAQSDTEGAAKSARDLENALNALGDASPAALETTLGEIEQSLVDSGAQAQKLDRGLAEADQQGQELGLSVGKVADELQEATRGGAKLDTELDKANRGARNLSLNAADMARQLAAPVAAFLSINALIGSVTNRFREMVELTDKASRYNFNVEGLQAFGGVLEDAGGNAQDAERYIRRFADAMATAYGDANSAAGKALKALKVSAADSTGALKDSEVALLDLAGALETVDRKVAIDRLKDLGIIDPAMVKTVLAGRAALQQLLETEKAKGVVTAEGAAKARELKMALDDVGDEASALFNNLIARVTPSIVRVTEALINFSKWTKENATLIAGFARGVLASSIIVAAALWGTAIPAWAALAINVLAATWPIIAITAAVLAVSAAFALAYEDVQAFFSGQPSLIGELIGRYAWLRKTVEFIGKAWEWLKDTAVGAARGIWDVVSGAFRAIWGVAGPILGLIIAAARLVLTAYASVAASIWEAWKAVFGRLWPYIKPVLALIGWAVRNVGQIFGAIGKSIWDTWGKIFDWIGERIKALVGVIRGLTGLFDSARQRLEGGTRIPSGLAAGQGQLALAGASPIATQTPGVIAAGGSRRDTRLNVNNLTVNTRATDAKGMATAAYGALNSELRRAQADNEDGVER